ETGQQKFEASGQDLWVTGGPIRLTPGEVGGIQNTLVNSHTVAEKIRGHPAVKIAAPMAFQTVYVGRNTSEFETVVGVGVSNVGSSKINIQRGRSFERGDVHYAGGNYTGPMTYEVIIDENVANSLGIGVNDTVYIGGTTTTARRNEFKVVGVGSRFSRFLGASTVTLHLSELQEITNTITSDRATFITVNLKEGANPSEVASELEEKYGYQVRTNQEQLESILGNQVVIIASAGVLVFVAVIAGIVLTANVLAMVVYHQEETLAALKAMGVSSRTLVGVFAVQGLLFGVVGGVFGLALTPLAADVLNYVAGQVVGFDSLVRTPPAVFVAGGVIAVVI
ncbi:MAG: ABC transporter permease, partial [Halobacteria archaeon]|nr:ABC transporter permease [Halobacteria archaeon]